MPVELAVLAKDAQPRQDRFVEAKRVADALLDQMNGRSVQEEIRRRHVLGAPSQQIQAVIEPIASRLGFLSEKKGLFAEYPTSALRPDYYMRIGDTGILMEVERGKTTTNNMDLLDFWKCHICSIADYLFLIVPQVRPSASGARMLHYQQVQNRLGTFFEPRNHVNVDAVFVFGY